MNYPHLGTINVTMVSTALGMGIGFLITFCAVALLYRVFPQMRRPAVFFWVMLGILMVSSMGSMVILSSLQVQNKR